jgi:hypothetical protein
LQLNKALPHFCPVIKLQMPTIRDNGITKKIQTTMKRKKLMAAAIIGTAIIAGTLLYAADHVDTPTVTGQSSDITDVYIFRGQDPNNLVFVANTQGLMSPSATGSAKFDPNMLLEFNIDNNNDNVEDLLIQAIVKDGKMQFYGPVAPSSTGTRSRLEGALSAEVAVTAYGAAPSIASQNGLTVFAGPRDDPFFFDLTRFRQIIAGTASAFNNPGTDSFAGTNVLSVIVEVPKSRLNATGGKINVWLETKKKI